MTSSPVRCLLAASLFAAGVAHAAPTLQTTNFIGNGYTHFNGFESANAQSGGPYTGGYTEGGISVLQTIQSGFSSSIRTNSVAGGFEGQQSWGPPGGDFGYTDITKTDGSDFVEVGFLVGSAYGTAVSGGGNTRTSVFIYYEMLNNGVIVKSETLSGQSVDAHWLGFSGGGFDEIRLRDGADFVGALYTPGGSNGLFIDSIKTAGDAVSTGGQVPEPGGMALASLALGLLAGSRKLRGR